jgi:hypothetical protein
VQRCRQLVEGSSDGDVLINPTEDHLRAWAGPLHERLAGGGALALRWSSRVGGAGGAPQWLACGSETELGGGLVGRAREVAMGFWFESALCWPIDCPNWMLAHSCCAAAGDAG